MANTTNTGSLKVAGDGASQKIPTINTLLDEFDSAFGGYLEKSVAGSGNVTLTRAEALHVCLKLTGVLTGARVVLIPHLLGASRFINIWNATSGAFSLTVKTTAGGSTGPAITQGKSQLVFHNNTNVHIAAPEVTP